jgi:alpha-galactosidase
LSKKISLIGAGSAIFSLNLIRDICLTPSLQGFTISLMDIDPGRLDGAFRLCRRYAQEMGLQLNLEKTTSREQTLDGADYIINTALAGGWSRIEPGWEIGLKYGYRFGGSLHFMHDEAFWINFGQLRLFDSLAEDILRICPQAWYFKIANPVFAGTTYIGRKYPELKCVGLCHGFSGVYNLIDALGLDTGQVTFEIPGVNHYVWLNHFLYRGENAFPLIDQWLAEHDNSLPGTPWELSPKKVDLYRRLGAYPIGDTGSTGGGDWPWWHHVDEATEQRFNEDPQTWFQNYIYDGYASVAKLQAVSVDETVKISAVYPPVKSGEVVVPMIESLAGDIPRVMICNLMNRRGGLVPGVPEDLAVEVPALVSGRGVMGIQTNPLPKGVLAYLLRDYAAPVDLELAAFEQHSLKLLLELVMQDPWTRSRQQAQAALDEILALPFNEEMRSYYR